MTTRHLGNSTLTISELGFGCLGLNSVYGEADDPATLGRI
jgi:aryl-alcohol dehydrogenase-like predicted oxidoreductase